MNLRKTVALVFLSFAMVGVSAVAGTGLGDLTKFRKIAQQTTALVEKGDLGGAKIRIKELETSWDEAEAGIKSRAAGDWRKIDKAIDKALEVLRESRPIQASCKRSMDDLMATFSQVEFSEHLGN